MLDADGQPYQIFAGAGRGQFFGVKLPVRGGDERLLARLTAAGVVAVGRAIGLRDCDDARCAMGAATSPEALDKRQLKLCVTCETALAKGDRAWAKS